MVNRSMWILAGAPTAGLTLLAAVVLVAAPGGVSGNAPAAQARARDFAFEDINPASPSHGSTLALRDLYGERGLVLQFVASWCKPCRDELPGLQQLHESERAPIVLVAADEYGYTEGVLIVAERTRLTTPILFVPPRQAEEMEAFYDHDILPATYLIDRRGAIREVHEGAWSAARLTAAIERSLD
jgi:cytochrome c-type biogenesis protein